MSVAVVNFAKGGWYVDGQKRLENDLIRYGKFKGAFYGYKSETQIQCPTHQTDPYAFKPYAMEKAHQKHNIIFWMDSSVVPIKPIQPIIDIINDKGYFMEYAGHWAGTWTNDKTLKYHNLTRDETMKIPLFVAGLFALDFDREISRKFFKQWMKSCKDGMFRGAWKNQNNSESQDKRCQGHRHDMSNGGIIAHKLGMKFSIINPTYISYLGHKSKKSHFVVAPCTPKANQKINKIIRGE